MLHKSCRNHSSLLFLFLLGNAPLVQASGDPSSSGTKNSFDLLYNDRKMPINIAHPEECLKKEKIDLSKMYLFYEATHAPIALFQPKSLQKVFQQGHTLRARPRKETFQATFQSSNSIKVQTIEINCDIKGDTQTLQENLLLKSGYQPSDIKSIEIETKENNNVYVPFFSARDFFVYQLLEDHAPKMIFHIKATDWSKRMAYAFLMCLPAVLVYFRKRFKSNELESGISYAPHSYDEELGEKKTEKPTRRRKRRQKNPAATKAPYTTTLPQRHS